MSKIITQIDAFEMGNRLRMARNASQLTQDEAAHKLNLARTTLLAIEKGVRLIRLDELRQFAKLYEQPINRLLQPNPINIDLIGRFRRQGVSPEIDTEGNKTLQLLTKFSATSVEIERELNVSNRVNYPPEVSIKIGRISELAEDAALSVRQHLGIGISPIQDLISIMEIEMGVRVFITALPSKVSGAFAFDRQVGACIIINALHPPHRQNMTAAHELGHLVGSRNDIDLNENPHREDRREEKFANAFAVAFLIPASWTRRSFANTVETTGKFSPRDLVLMSQSAFVSPEAMCRRLESLDLLKAGMWESLKERGFNAKFVKSLISQPDPKSNLSPPRLSWLAAGAIEKGIISEGQLVERLGLDRIRIRELLDAMLIDGSNQLEQVEE